MCFGDPTGDVVLGDIKGEAKEKIIITVSDRFQAKDSQNSHTFAILPKLEAVDSVPGGIPTVIVCGRLGC